MPPCKRRLKKSLAPWFAEALSGERAVFFIDAAHVVFAPFWGIVWCFTRLFVKAPSGRQRLHVLAALNAISHELVTVEHLTDMTAESVCELLRLVAGASRVSSARCSWTTPAISAAPSCKLSPKS
jgi:hypothetical protein